MPHPQSWFLPNEVFVRLRMQGTTLAVFAALLSAATSAPAQTSSPWYDRITASGDFRVRAESFVRGDAADRTRLRVRFRAGLAAPLGDDFRLGVRLATVTPGNVTSANVSLGDALTGKNITLDRAYLAWAPHSRVEVTAGKFAMPMWLPRGELRSELMFDDEVAPEGFHQTFTLLERQAGLLRRALLLTDQWILREASNASDTWMLGGQAVVELAPTASLRVDVSAAYYDYASARALAQERNGNSELLVTNSVITQSGQIVQGGAARSPSESDPFDRFVSTFDIMKFSAGVTRSGVLGQDLAAWVDVLHNRGAATANDGFWAGASLGATREPGDWSVAAAYARLEQEAVLSMFSYSDLGMGGTNVEGAILQASWRPLPAVRVRIKDHVITPILAVPGGNLSTVHRVQIDAWVSF